LTAWSNDNAEGFQGAHHVDPSHLNTPASLEIDALGRVVRSVARPSGTEQHTIRTVYDIRGNILRVVDPLGRDACSYVYDLESSGRKSSRILREEGIDAGIRRMVFDAAGREIERRDSKGAITLQAYDAANRPTHLWARDRDGLPVTLRQRLVYGDVAGLADPAALNMIGRFHQQFDEAGLVEIAQYDFRGNVLVQNRRVIADSALVAVMGGADTTPFQVDWERLDQEAALDPRVHRTDCTYDALNRVKRVTFPEDVSGDRKVLVPLYTRHNALEQVHIVEQNGTVDRPFVVHIAYNARGQRGLVAYGNGVMTRYAYDAATFQVSRMRSERYVQPGPFDFVPAGGVLQDVGYEHDLVGNITRMSERSPGTGVPGTLLGADALDRVFHYDPLYRLLSATGREHDSRNPSSDPWLDEMSPTSQDNTATRTYTREYEYDPNDNLTLCRHMAGDPANFTRRFTIDAASNHLASSQQGTLEIPFAYDPCGNLTGEDTTRHFEWNHANRLVRFRLQAGDSVPSIEAAYLYDASGQRVKKVVRTQDGTVRSVTYVGNSFEHLREGDVEQSLILVQDVVTRAGQWRIGPAFAGDEGPDIQYFLTDQVGCTNVVVDQSGAFIRREEFYPYGGTSFGSFARARYRFTGKERDEESGLSYHRVRYYAPALARWVSPDPRGTIDGLNLYQYGRSNPIRYYDASGTQSSDGVRYIGSTVYHEWQGVIFPPEPETPNRFVQAVEWVGSHLWSGVKWIASTDYEIGRHEFQWTLDAMKLMWQKGKNAAGTIWSWAKNHTLLAGGIAIGIAVIGLLAGKSLWEWVLAPAIRIASNAAFGYAMFGTPGAIIGALLGAAHGFAMAKAGSYNWTGQYGLGWLSFISDNTWSLANSFVGSVFAAVNLPWNDIDEKTSRNTNELYFKTGWIPTKDTTLGNVTVGTSVPTHESVHAYQARLLGPFYIPLVVVSYEVATVLPYWLLYGHCSVSGFGSYFMKGVYPNTLHELVAYAFEGNAC